MRIFCTVLALMVVVAAVAVAAETTETPPSGSRPSTRLTTQSGFAGSSETTISGLCVDRDGRPLSDVAAKLYVGGLLASEVTTSIDGSFEIVELIDYGVDTTIDMWFVPAEEGLVMENVILKESSSAVQNALYSECVPRVRLDPITDFVVRILDFDSRLRMLETADCLN